MNTYIPYLSTATLKRYSTPALIVAFGLFYLLPMMFHGLWIPDETRYAQISQEMLLSGNWTSPHFMGLRYFEKPIAGYWMIAIGQAIFGENLFGVRVASALSTGLSALLTYLIARRLWNNPRKSFASALLFMSFGLIAGQAGYANLDPQFTLWSNLSLVAFWFATDSRPRSHRLWAWAALGLGCGMGFLTKGFLALLLPVLIALPYMTWQRRLGELLRHGPIAVVVAVAVALPWVLVINAQEPDYWNFFFWHEHIQRFAGNNAQHAQPWWFYLPLLVVSCLPWSVLLVPTFKQAWQEKHQAGIGFLWLWFVLPLAFFSLSRGKLPTYIMPCLLPLALMMGNALIDRVTRAQGRALRLNGVLNLILGVAALVALIALQATHSVYANSHADVFSLSLVFIMLMAWIITNALQVLRPVALWAMPALGIALLVALLPAGMPASVVSNKMPDQFIAEHIDELRQTSRLLSNELGTAAALSWRLQRPQVDLFNTAGELKYGLGYPDAQGRQVTLETIGQWMSEARRQGSVGVVMRVKDTAEMEEIGLLPPDGKRYKKGNSEIIIFPQTQP